jgi:hypothetical protein
MSAETNPAPNQAQVLRKTFVKPLENPEIVEKTIMAI